MALFTDKYNPETDNVSYNQLIKTGLVLDTGPYDERNSLYWT